MNSIRALLSGLIDYAGLFPPAGLDMRAAVASYSGYLESPDASALGRFIVPAQRLEEFEQAFGTARLANGSAWRLSVVLGEDTSHAMKRVLRFRESHENGPGIAAVELKASAPRDINPWRDSRPEAMDVFIEVPLDDSLEFNMAAIATTGARAKIRTGGVTPDAIPASLQVLRFLRLCHGSGLAFKATAGLHHPLRAIYPLTYETRSASAEMFGFLNIFLAAAMVWSDAADEIVLQMLDEKEPSAFRFSDDSVTWRGHALTTEELRDSRVAFALSFGSCSFREPVDELRKLTAHGAAA